MNDTFVLALQDRAQQAILGHGLLTDATVSHALQGAKTL
jgi:hypothetical protein